MMKPGECKRVLFIFSFCCFLFFIYLYWQQSAIVDPSKLIYVFRNEFNKEKKTYPPQWTWQCVNHHCERQQIVGKIPIVSLASCSMLCGSTQLWPQPTGPVSLGSKAVIFNHQQLEFEAIASEPTHTLLQQSFALFNSNVVNLVQSKDYIEQFTEIGRFLVKVTVSRPKVVKLKLHTDESYSLMVKSKDNEIFANITAKTFFGARHGLETLSQLIWWDEYDGGVLKILSGASIQDGPVFPYRGVMVDTARNFMSVNSLKRVLEGMSANKLNVFHWHITDSQSFPLIAPRVPQLAKHGAYGPDMVYTAEDVKDLVDFARIRGIRVVLEVDTPAHAGNGWTWGQKEGLGELAVCVNERPWTAFCGEPPCGQLNPDNPNVYNVLEKLYRDLLELSDENEIFHLGGDEVNLDCWAQHLQKSAALLNYTDLHDLWGEFTLKALRRLQSANGGKIVPVVIVWSSNLSKKPYVTKYLDKKNIVVQSWGASQWPDTPDLIADGYRVIISHVDAWYLDCGFGRWRETGEATCDPYRPWQTVYSHRPWQQLRLNKKQILGGEACLWSEQFSEISLDTRLWPRAAAFAERVWSDPQLDINTYSIQEDVYTRLNTHRDRLITRGLGAEALWPVWCKQNPGMCL